MSKISGVEAIVRDTKMLHGMGDPDALADYMLALGQLSEVAGETPDTSRGEIYITNVLVGDSALRGFVELAQDTITQPE